MSVRSHEFGRELRRRRLAAGLSLTGLARSVHYSKAQLSKVERGLKEPSRELARLCAARLDADGTLIALVQDQSFEPMPSTVVETDESWDEVWLMHLSIKGASWFQPTGRRQLLLGGAASLVPLGARDTVWPTAVRDMSALEGFQVLFHEYRRIGQTTSPGALLPALIAQTHVLRDIATATYGEERRRALRLASRYAEYIGWLTQEAGDDDAAMWWTERAGGLAAAGGDPALASYASVRRALVALYRKDGDRTIALARNAQDVALPTRIRMLALQREAQGHAVNGDHTASMRCLDASRDLSSQAESAADEPVLGTTNLTDPPSMITGWCLFDLGRPQEAADVLAAELERVSSHALRARTRFGVRQARALAVAGEVDQACHLVAPLLPLTSVVDSATIRADLAQLAKTLHRHHRNHSVRALTLDLGSALNPARRQEG